jgi:uncharacterized repeat protein (TIGR02543 family)
VKTGGPVTITATSTSDASKKAMLSIKVIVAVEEIKLEPAGPVEVEVGRELAITVRVLPEGASQAIDWTSSDDTKAKVENGKILGLAEGGPVTLTAISPSDKTKKATIDVTVIPPTSFTIRFDLNGANPGAAAIPNQGLFSGEKVKRPADPAKTGYTVTGWFTAAGVDGVKWNFDEGITESMTLYAHYQPVYTYLARKLTKAVTIDGVIGAAEWDDANELFIDVDNAILNEYGEFQGDDGVETKAFYKNGGFKVKVKIKWDEEALYILEDRDNGAVSFTHTETSLGGPWRGRAGTLFFLGYDDLSGGDLWANNFQILWVDRTAGGGPAEALLRYTNIANSQSQAKDIKWNYAAKVTANIGVFEIRIPWTTLAEFAHSPETIAGGELFRMNPLWVYGSDDGQVNGKQAAFYNLGVNSKHNDWVTTSPANSSGGELPVNWAGLLLVE